MGALVIFVLATADVKYNEVIHEQLGASLEPALEQTFVAFWMPLGIQQSGNDGSRIFGSGRAQPMP